MEVNLGGVAAAKKLQPGFHCTEIAVGDHNKIAQALEDFYQRPEIAEIIAVNHYVLARQATVALNGVPQMEFRFVITWLSE